MKKTLVALAALAATSAFAQSSVTAYGVLDAGYSTMSREVTKQDGTVGVKEGAKGFAFNSATTSRIGFKGQEDLGNGSKANFIIETGIGSNRMAGFSQTAISTSTYKGVGANGTTLDATTIGNRELNASLDFASGTSVGIGFGSTAVRVMSLGFDAAGGANFIGSAITNDAQFSSNRTTGAAITQKVGDFTVGAALAANKTSETAKDDIKVGQGSTLSLAYAAGPLAFGAAHQSSKTTVNAADSSGLRCILADNANPTTYTIAGYANAANQGCNTTGKYTTLVGSAAVLASDKKVTTDFVGASYDLGMAKLFAAYGKVKTNDIAQLDATGEGSRKAYSFGAQVPVGAFVPFASYSSGKVEQVSSGIKINASGTAGLTAGKAATSRDITGYNIGARYNMSKRTLAYVSMGETKLNGSNEVSGSADFGSKIKQTAIGLVHNF